MQKLKLAILTCIFSIGCTSNVISDLLEQSISNGSRKATSSAVNEHIELLLKEYGGGTLHLYPREYTVMESIVLHGMIQIVGEGLATVLKAHPNLNEPVVKSANSISLDGTNAYQISEGVPYGFALRNLRIMGNYEKGESKPTHPAYWKAGVYLYGKHFTIEGVYIFGTSGYGFYSAGSTKGDAESDPASAWATPPEAIIDVRVERSDRDCMQFLGPHDSIIRSAILSRCKGRGLYVGCDGQRNGAADIGYVHAYGTQEETIHINAKFKADFLQGDTGSGAAVVIHGGGQSMVSRIEAFKTRGSRDDYAVQIYGPSQVIGQIRVRADWGTNGVLIQGRGAQIGTIAVDGHRRGDGPWFARGPNNKIGVELRGDNIHIGSLGVRAFPEGTCLRMGPGASHNKIGGGYTAQCAIHFDMAESGGYNRVEMNSIGATPGEIKRRSKEGKFRYARNATDQIVFYPG